MRKRHWVDGIWSAVEKWEKILFRSIILGLIALVVTQSLLTADPMRFYLSWSERLEGEPIENWSGATARVTDEDAKLFATMTIELKDFTSLAKAKLLINGEEVADFRKKQITVRVYPEDVIEIDGSFYNRHLNFEVIKISSNILQPLAHQKIQTNRNIAKIGKVKFK